MSDIRCPYCDHEQEIDHDDGYGYEEGDDHEQECVSCEKIFNYTTSISFSYNVYCNDDEEHDLENSESHPTLYSCTKCDYYEVRK